MLKDRILRAHELMEHLHVDALLVTGLPNIRYLSGFTGSDGLFMLTRNGSKLLVDGRYSTQARQQAVGSEIVSYQQKVESVQRNLAAAGAVRVAFEAERMSVATHATLFNSLTAVKTVPITVELDELRQCKDRCEVALLEKAASLASKAVEDILRDLVPGTQEQQVSLAIEHAMKLAGAEGCAFDFIVASGERGALPHGRASSKPIMCGDLVTIDFGAVHEGYHSDETVTVVIGSPDKKQREIYTIVKEAHDLAIDAVRPGASLSQIDAIARDHIDKQGFGEYFNHGLGHGVGLEIHEKPTVNSKSTAVAVPGMVFTIEPGIYIPGWGGVRIEDTILVTADGCRLLTKMNKDLIVVAD
jgi:Xaa-Pro aminopeptidase